MTKLRTLLLSVVLAVATIATPVAILGPTVVLQGCKSASRATYNTLASVGKTVDLAEREYLDRVLAGTVKTNNFTQIQASYASFQTAYGVAVSVASNNTNALAPLSLSQAAAKFVNDVQQAIKSK